MTAACSDLITLNIIHALPVPNVCVVALRATVSCPSISGYTTTVGADHPGDDIGCYGGTDFNTAASACNSNPSCKAFNVVPSGGFYCTKVSSSPLTGASNVCFYTKNTATGEAWAGYRVGSTGVLE